MTKRMKSVIREVFKEEAPEYLDFQHARTLAYSVAGEMDKLKTLVDEYQSECQASSSAAARARAALRAGAGLWIMQKYAEACKALSAVSKDKTGVYLLGLCQTETGDYDNAVKSFKAAASAGQDKFMCEMAATEALRRAGKREEALAKIRTFQKSHDSEAELHYQKGRCLEEALDYGAAVDAYERAVELNPQHVGALFRLGYWNDLYGNDEVAVDCYEKAAAVSPVNTSVLINLGLLYEDQGKYKQATKVYERILAVDRSQMRARLYYKDAVASMFMYYDEAVERRESRTALLLQTPLNEFELSTRSRSCLEQMDVRTLGDLARLTEDDITSSKNLGDTSFAELCALLETKGLHFGMGAEQGGLKADVATSSDQSNVMTKPIGELNLSIRSQKCMRTLGVEIAGDLTQKTEKTLLACQNFGQTSLAEVKNKLAKLGLELKAAD